MTKALLFLLLISTNVSSQESLKDGLIMHYTFNGKTIDESGKNNNPIFNNTTLTEDRFGNKNSACYFNGKSNYIQIRNSSSLSPDEITLVAFIKPLGFYNGLCYNNSIIEKGARDYLPGNYSLRFTAGEYTHGDCHDGDSAHQNFVGMVAANGGKTSSDIFVKPGTWYCVVFTYTKQFSKLFIDGELITSFANKGKIGKNKDDLFLGKKDNSQYPYWFNGVMDEIRIYNRTLSTDEVSDLYTQLNQKQ